MAKSRVLILGGGFGGVTAALDLRKRAPDLEVALVSSEDCFTFYPSIYEYAASSLPEKDVCVPLNLVLGKHGVTFFHDTVVDVDFQAKKAKTARNHELHFDYLILALGAVTNYYGIPGAKEFALPLKTKEDAEDLYEELQEAASVGKPVKIVICGGGLTGVEFGAELADFLHEKCDHEGQLCYRGITLLHLGDKLVPEFPEFADLVKEKLTKKGIDVHLSEPVVKVEKGKVTTARAEYPADLILWAGGIQTHPFIQKMGLDLVAAQPGFAGRAMPGGGLAVNEFLQTLNHPFVFGVGDCVSPMDAKTGKPVIKTAQNAIQEGELVAVNITALSKNQPLRPFVPQANFALFTVGRDFAVLKHMGVTLKGGYVRSLKALIENRFFARLK